MIERKYVLFEKGEKQLLLKIVKSEFWEVQARGAHNFWNPLGLFCLRASEGN